MCEIRDVLVLVMLILCSISDLWRRGVYTWILIAMSILLAPYCLFYCQSDLVSVLAGMGVGLVFLLVSHFSKEAIGYADSWLILLLGGYLGLQRVVTLLTIAFMLTGLVGLVGLTIQKLKRASTIPFIPFLTVAYLGVFLL